MKRRQCIGLAAMCLMVVSGMTASLGLAGPPTGSSTILNSSNGKAMCLIFSGNGQDQNPSRYLWGAGDKSEFCGFSSRQELLNNKQAVWTLVKLR